MAQIYVNGRVHVRRARCASCIFRPVDKGRCHGITDERVEQMIEGCGDWGAIACHSHLYRSEPVEPVCRGFFDLGQSVALRLADVMGVIEWV